MKYNVKITQKISLRTKLYYAILGSLSIALVIGGCILYISLSNQKEALAASGDGTCKTTIYSGNTGYNTSFKPYSVNIEAEVVRVVPSSLNCQYGYNYNIEVAYNISFGGNGTPNVNTLQGAIVCNDATLTFDFPANARINGGSGTFITTVNPYRSNSDCATATPSSLGCTDITITIAGEAIPTQSNVACPKNTLLPITLAKFEGKQIKNQNILTWSTSQEINNDFFTIERSADGKSWESIAEVAGAGNSPSGKAYEYVDKEPSIGMNYYRIKQTDFNGDFEYFNIIGVSYTHYNNINPDPESKLLQVIPNPFGEYFKISYTSETSEKTSFTLTDVAGKLIKTVSVPSHPGKNEYVFNDTNDLKSGIYFISMIVNGQSETVKIIKE